MKKLYLVAERGYGEGCDYTIGCNQRWSIEEFDGNLEEATAHFTKEITLTPEDEEDWVRRGVVPKLSHEGATAEIVVVPMEFGYSEPDLDAMRAASLVHIKAKLAEKQKADAEKKDLEDFNRLQAKFGKK